MKDLPAIARYMRLTEEQLRFPVELLNQGYEPNYLATYRPDELGGLDSKTLSKLKRSVVYESKLTEHKQQLSETLQREGIWSDSVAKVIGECTSVSQVDAIIKSVRAKKSAKAFSESDPNIGKLGQAILLYRGEQPSNLQEWISRETGVSIEEATPLLEKTKRWMQLLLSEDPQLLLNLQRALLRQANVTVKVLPEPSNATPSDINTEHVVVQASATKESPAAVTHAPELANTPEVTEGLTDSESSTTSNPVLLPSGSVEGSSVEPSTDNSATTATESTSGEEQPVSTETAIPEFRKDRKQNKQIKTKSLSEKQLSPRQRRRRWLRSILESYSKMRKPLRALTPFQILMLSRGLRSQIIELNYQIDQKPLVQMCRDSLCAGRHPMHPLLMEVAESGLKEQLLPRVQNDVLAILEEDANQELIEGAVEHLEACLLQRPVLGHRILMIDAVGQKTAAVAIVDAEGKVLFAGDIPCNSSKPDVVARNVTQLGQWVHEHQVTLVVLTNGHARRYLIHSVAELMKQSTEGSLYWTFADRQGADSFCMSRNSLVELPKIARRHRAAVWMAWKLQDPLRQILKIEPARLRLGSYQRELPQAELEHALQEAISAAITKAGVDMYSADEEVLRRIPGIDDATAKRLVEERQKGSITNRESLMHFLKESLPEMQARQAIGFLRVYSSDNPLDGTIIHPDDYRLAQRLVANAQLPMPPVVPEGWTKPDYEKIAQAIAAANAIAIEQASGDPLKSEGVEAFGFEAHADEINPNFGQIEDETEQESDTSPESTEPQVPPAQETTEVSGSSEETEQSEAMPTESDAPASTGETVETGEPVEAKEVPEPRTPAQLPSAHMPIIPELPMEKPPLSVDADKLARSWQVGRAKLLSVCRSLQFPFADGREFQFPVPLRSYVPSLDRLSPGKMLSALVIGIADFGVFVELGPDCSGLIHISQLGPAFVEDPHQFVQVGDVIPVWVLSTDEKKKRVALTALPPGSARESNSREPAERDTRPQQDRRKPFQQQQGSGDGKSTSRERYGNRDSKPGHSGARDGGRSSGGNRPQRDRGQQPNRRDRNTSESSQAEAREERAKRPVKIERPAIEKPLTEGMQTGKEPLRSFSDLMQFIKQGNKPASSDEQTRPVSPPPTEEAPQPSAEDIASSEGTEGNV